MNPRPTEVGVPPGSRIATMLAGSSFHDAWSVRSSHVGLPALGHFLAAAKRTPRWVDLCMGLRNRTGRWVGLKDLGALSAVSSEKPAMAYRPGDRVGIFTVFENTFGEALIGDKDKHLDVVLSIHCDEQPGQPVTVTVTTVVHVKNGLGRLYMVPVKPMHRLIAPAVLAAMEGSVDATQNASHRP